MLRRNGKVQDTMWIKCSTLCLLYMRKDVAFKGQAGSWWTYGNVSVLQDGGEGGRSTFKVIVRGGAKSIVRANVSQTSTSSAWPGSVSSYGMVQQSCCWMPDAVAYHTNVFLPSRMYRICMPQLHDVCGTLFGWSIRSIRSICTRCHFGRMKLEASPDKKIKKGKVPQLFFIGASPYDPITLIKEVRNLGSALQINNFCFTIYNKTSRIHLYIRFRYIVHFYDTCRIYIYVTLCFVTCGLQIWKLLMR